MMAKEVIKAILVRKVIKARREILVILDLKVPVVFKENRVTRAIRETKVILAHKARTEKMAQTAFPPIVSLSKSGKVTTLEITDKNGKQTAEIKDGEDGQGGGTAGGKAIIDVAELPTENINTEVFYRILSAIVY